MAASFPYLRIKRHHKIHNTSKTQVTRVGASVSAPLYLNGGIPQGTKLGPVLFAVMVNDLVQSWGAHIKFVDDLKVLEVVPRNSPSFLNVVVDDIHAFAVL